MLPLKAWAMPVTPALPQLLEQAVGRPAHMQDHGQAVTARQQELFAVKKFLARRIQAGHEIIQPDLADRHQPRVVLRVGQGLVQPVQVIGRGAARAQRMDTQGVAVAVAMGQFTHRGEVGHLDRRQHAMHHMRLPRRGPARPSVSAENSAASRWQCVSIHAGMAP